MWALGFGCAATGFRIRGGASKIEVLARQKYVKREQYFAEIKLKSLILAQIERWRHALHMQVERESGGNSASRVANG